MKNGQQNLLCAKGFNMMKIIDAHTHIDYITQNFQSNVVGCVCCATMEDDWTKIIDLIKFDNRIYGAFGVHPWFVDSGQSGFDKRLEDLLKTDANYMVGEIGLDKHKPDMEKQISVFITQFNIAIKLHRVVCLHCVGAWDKILHILKQYSQDDLPIIIVHGFNENIDILTKLLQYKSIYFSLSQSCISARNNCIEQIPSNHILVESDGKKDVLLSKIVDTISNIKKDSKMADIIYNNSQRVLKNE